MGIRPEDIDDEPEFMAKHTDCQLDTQVDVSEMMGAEDVYKRQLKGHGFLLLGGERANYLYNIAYKC